MSDAINEAAARLVAEIISTMSSRERISTNPNNGIDAALEQAAEELKMDAIELVEAAITKPGQPIRERELFRAGLTPVTSVIAPENMLRSVHSRPISIAEAEQELEERTLASKTNGETND